MRRALVVALILLAAAFGPAALLSHVHAGADDHHHGLGLDHLPVHHDHGEGDAPVLESGFDCVPGREGPGFVSVPLALEPVAHEVPSVGTRGLGEARPWRPPVASRLQEPPPSLRAPPR